MQAPQRLHYQTQHKLLYGCTTKHNTSSSTTTLPSTTQATLRLHYQTQDKLLYDCTTKHNKSYPTTALPNTTQAPLRLHYLTQHKLPYDCTTEHNTSSSTTALPNTTQTALRLHYQNTTKATLRLHYQKQNTKSAQSSKQTSQWTVVVILLYNWTILIFLFIVIMSDVHPLTLVFHLHHCTCDLPKLTSAPLHLRLA